MKAIRPGRMVDVVLLFFVFFLANTRAIIFFDKYPDASNFLGQAWREAYLWLVLLSLIFIVMRKEQITGDFFRRWKAQGLLIAFLLFAFLSVIWSVSWVTTLQRSLVFVFASLAGAYLATRYSFLGFVRILFWGGVVFMAFSFLMAVIYPGVGTDLNPPYNGAWRGIFWHKNHLGNLIPLFSLVFLLSATRKNTAIPAIDRGVAIALYLISLLLVYFSRSASGYILEAILLFGVMLAMVWLRFADRLEAKHYVGALLVAIIGIGLLFLNLDFVFRLLNREPTLTGRVPLWAFLMKHFYLQKPWLGYGFGTFWAVEGHRLQMQAFVGWGYPVMIGDNGFIDILINLGALGLLMFLCLYALLWIKSICFALKQREIVHFFAPLFLVYTLFANLSFSLLMETEVLIWLVFVAILILVQNNGKSQTEVPG